MRNLAFTRASPSAEDLDQNGPAIQILQCKRWRVKPCGPGKFGHGSSGLGGICRIQPKRQSKKHQQGKRFHQRIILAKPRSIRRHSYPRNMPWSQFRTQFPGSPPAGEGLLAGVLRFFITLFFLGLLMLVVVISVVLGLLFLFLRALGIGSSRQPRGIFTTFSAAPGKATKSAAPRPTVDADSLESFPGSLEDYLREKSKK